MRFVRHAAVAVLALGGTVAVPLIAHGAAGPAAPYTAMVLTPRYVSMIGGASLTFDESNADLSVADDDNEPNRFVVWATTGSEYWSAALAPPTGTDFVAGTTYATRWVADATRAEMRLGGPIPQCIGGATGSMTVREFTRDAATGQVTALAASFTTGCLNAPDSTAGELRWNSSIGYAGLHADPRQFAFGNVEVGQEVTATVTLTGRGSEPVTFGTAYLVRKLGVEGAFTVSADGCSGVTLEYGETCTVTARARLMSPVTHIAELVLPANLTSGRTAVALNAFGHVSWRDTFYPIAPVRLMDTRSGLGVPQRPLGKGTTATLQVTGRGGLPATGVGAVIVNVTVAAPTENSYLTLYPGGEARPGASSINFPKGWVGANSVTVKVGAGGKINIYNNAGNAPVIVDVTGYYAADGSTEPYLGGQYQPIEPTRLLDTRLDGGQRLPGGHYASIPVDFGPSVNSHIRALVVNVTAVGATGDGFLTAWNGDVSAIPGTSTLNYSVGRVVPNMAVVPTFPCQDCEEETGLPSVGVYTQRDTHLIVDIVGFFDDATLPDGLRFRPMSPTRVVDTRTGQGLPGALGAGTTATVSPPPSIATEDTYALAMNFTTVAPSATTWLTIWPAGMERPPTSIINPAKGQVVSNAAITLLGSDNRYHVYNAFGATHVINDIVGAFYQYPGTAARSASATWRTRTLQDTIRRVD